MTPLHQRMIEDMQFYGLSARTQKSYVRAVKGLAEMMPVDYFHLVFTLLCEYRGLVRRHQKIAYGVLFKAATAALMKLAADERYLGA